MRVCIACSSRFESGSWTCPSCGFQPAVNGFVRLVDEAREVFPEDALGALPELEERSFWFAARNALIAWAFGRHFPATRSFLEIGCGTGYVLRALHARHPDVRMVGGDVSPGALAVAHERMPDVEFLQVDARALPFAEEFDVVGAFDVLEHEPDDVGALHAISGALRPGGGLILTVPQHPRLWSAVDAFSHHVRRYTRRELVGKVEATGFDVLDSTSFVTLLLPAVVASRLRHRDDTQYDQEAEYRLSPLVDRAFAAAMVAERRLICGGVRLPVGSSLLLVARLRPPAPEPAA
jgi:SAM-dependent methyltransferase